jgi:hypothetical protein
MEVEAEAVLAADEGEEAAVAILIVSSPLQIGGQVIQTTII